MILNKLLKFELRLAWLISSLITLLKALDFTDPYYQQAHYICDMYNLSIDWHLQCHIEQHHREELSRGICREEIGAT